MSTTLDRPTATLDRLTARDLARILRPIGDDWRAFALHSVEMPDAERRLAGRERIATYNRALTEALEAGAADAELVLRELARGRRNGGRR